MSFSIKSSKMGARQGLAQTHIAAYDHAQRSAPPIDLVWLTWSWMFVHDIRESLRVNGLGALHLRNGSESQRPDSSCALPHSWAVHSFNQNVRTPSRSGGGALLNSDMRGRDPFLNEMIELLTQRAWTPLTPSSGRGRESRDRAPARHGSRVTSVTSRPVTRTAVRLDYTCIGFP